MKTNLIESLLAGLTVGASISILLSSCSSTPMAPMALQSSFYQNKVAVSAPVALQLSVTNPVASVTVETPSWDSAVTLAWNPSTSADVAGYAVYYRKMPSGSLYRYDAKNRLQCSIGGLAAVVYSFYVVAYDLSGVESLPSNEVLFTPAPRLVLRQDRFSVETPGIFGMTNVIKTSSNLVDWRTVLQFVGTGVATNYLHTNQGVGFFKLETR